PGFKFKPWMGAVALGVVMVALGLGLGLVLGVFGVKPGRKPPPVEKPPVEPAQNPVSPPAGPTVEEDDAHSPGTSPDGDGKEHLAREQKGGDAVLRLIFENASPVAVTISCSRQKPCIMETQKLCIFSVGNEPGKCEASAPGHKAQAYSFRD